MPTSGVRQCSFTLVHQDAVNNLGAGTVATQIAQPYWEISITTATLTRLSKRYREWRSFIMNLRGAKKIALMYDADHPRPAEYMKSGLPATTAGGNPFTGVAQVKTIINRRSIELNALPANLQLRAADWIEFKENGRYFLAQLVEDALGDSSGDCTISIEPALPLAFTDAATINLEKPCTEAILDPRSLPSDPRDLEGGVITLTARSRVF